MDGGQERSQVTGGVSTVQHQSQQQLQHQLHRDTDDTRKEVSFRCYVFFPKFVGQYAENVSNMKGGQPWTEPWANGQWLYLCLLEGKKEIINEKKSTHIRLHIFLTHSQTVQHFQAMSCVACIDDLEKSALSLLDRDTAEFFRGGADDEQTLRDNVAAYQR